MAKDKDASHKQARAGKSRVKALRQELLELETDLERARRRRDKAQARLEALEAIAEQLATAIVAAEASDDARVARREAAAAAAVAAGTPTSEQADAPSEPGATADVGTPPKARRTKRPATAKAGSGAAEVADGS